MSIFWKCLCFPFICCDCEPTVKTKKKKKRNKLLTKTTKNFEIKEYKVPEDYPTVDQCFSAQGISLNLVNDFIGKGSFGTVYKVIDKTGVKKACKRIDTGPMVRNKHLFESIKSELNVMNIANNNQNIVKMFNYFIITESKGKSKEEFCYIIMEFANGGTVLDKLKVKDDNQPYGFIIEGLSEKVAKDFFIQMTNGLLYLHKLGIAHKDLKLDNALVFNTTDKKICIKLCDFGISAIRYDEKSGHIIKERTGKGSVEYLSPQVLKLYIYDQFDHKVGKLREYNPFEADCWALGVCLFIMIRAKFPFSKGEGDKDSFIQMFKDMKEKNYLHQIQGKIVSRYSSDCFDLIDQLLTPIPNERLTAQIVLQHKWIKKTETYTTTSNS